MRVLEGFASPKMGQVRGSLVADRICRTATGGRTGFQTIQQPRDLWPIAQVNSLRHGTSSPVRGGASNGNKLMRGRYRMTDAMLKSNSIFLSLEAALLPLEHDAHKAPTRLEVSF